MMSKIVLIAAATTVAALVASVPSEAFAAEGLKVVKDPVTGQLRAPTAEESEALDAAAQALQAQGRSAATGRRGMVSGKAGPATVVHANGMKQQELDESTMSYSVVKRNANGTLDNYCVTGDKAATSIVKSRANPVSTSKGGQLELK